METAGSWIGLLAIISTGVIALLNKVVERRHSTEILELKHENRGQSLQLTANSQKIGELVGAVQKCEEKHKEKEEKLEKCEEKHETIEIRVKAIESALKK